MLISLDDNRVQQLNDVVLNVQERETATKQTHLTIGLLKRVIALDDPIRPGDDSDRQAWLDYWAIHDARSEWNWGKAPGDASQPTASVVTPIAFVYKDVISSEEKGIIAQLRIRRYDEGDCCYCQLSDMGLSTVSNKEEEGLLWITKHVWERSGLASCATSSGTASSESMVMSSRSTRASSAAISTTAPHSTTLKRPRFGWTLRSGPEELGFSNFALPTPSGRSAEAAFLCALWAANGGIPDDPDCLHDDNLQLDDKVLLTAKLGPPVNGGSLRGIPLQGVKGLKQKVNAAVKVGIDTVVIAHDHDKADEDAIDRGDRSKVTLLRVKTIGEAFDLLSALDYYSRHYRQAVCEQYTTRYQVIS